MTNITLQENKYMTNEEKNEIREIMGKLTFFIDSTNCADKNYILLMLKKIYAILGLRQSGPKPDHNKEFQEWLELMAWCEMWSMITYQDISGKNDKVLANFLKLREDIRQGIYLVKNDGKND